MTQEIELTKSQAVAKDKIEAFIKSDNRVFRLTGAAGYGKTTVIKYCLSRHLKIDNERKGYGKLPQVLGVALAHKAKNELKRSIINVATFAKTYGYKEVLHENGDRTFEPAKQFLEAPLGHCNIPVFVFDEVSMFNQQMIDIMLNETPKTSKIILLGDQAQLPPPGGENMVPDQDSPIFYMHFPEDCYHELTEPVRQKEGNPILDLAYVIREEIFGAQDLGRVIQEILKPRIVNGVGTEIQLRSQAIKSYVEGGDFLNNKIITYKNATVKSFNTEIRDIVLNKPKQKLVNGDIIFLTNNFRHDGPDFVLNNADEFIIDKVHINTFRVKEFVIESYFAFVTHRDFNFPVFVLIPTEEGERVYNKAIKELKNIGQQYRNWRPFYNLKDSFTEFTMGYVINAYRAQGSTYQNVYFDLMDILNCGPLTPKRMLQAIYTSITRASQRVIFIKND